MTAEALLDLIERDDAHPALLVPGNAATVSYSELHAAVERVAGELAGAGIVQGDAVAMSFPNGPEMVIAFLAIIAAGAAAAPLNPAYTADELRGYLVDLRPRAMILHGGAGEPARAACDELGIRVLDATAQAPAAVTVADGEGAALPARDPDARALLLHTSGTTSRPKVVPLRQRNLASSARAVAATYALDGADVSHCVMPLFHVHGLVASTLATAVHRRDGARAAALQRLARSGMTRCEHGATWYSAVPTIHAGADVAGGRRAASPSTPCASLARAARRWPRRCRTKLEERARRAARPGLRDDRGGSPDGVEPAAAGRAPPQLGRARHRHADRHPRRPVARAGGR